MKKLIKGFTFNNEDREGSELSDLDLIRINTEDGRKPILQLKADSIGEFSTDLDIIAKSTSYNPGAIKQWLGFEALGTFPDGTFAEYRFDNGLREIWFDTGDSTWKTAGATDFNTEDELSQNMDTFPFDNKSIRVVINLVTSDPKVTPTISEIKLLGLFDFYIYEDVVDSLMQAMHDKIRPITIAQSEVDVDTDTFDFSDEAEYKLQNDGYNIVDVSAIFNITVDPDKFNNLLDSYTPGSSNQDGETNLPGVATATEVIPAGDVVEFEIKYVPEIADHTDEDFYEVNRIPSINIETMEESNKKDGMNVEDSDSTSDFIRDKVNQTAVQVTSPAHIDLRFGYALFSDLSLDQKRMVEEMESFLTNCKLLRSIALDCVWGLENVIRVKTANKGSASNLMKATGILDIRSIALWVKPAIEVPMITQVNADFTTQ